MQISLLLFFDIFLGFIEIYMNDNMNIYIFIYHEFFLLMI